MSRPPTEIPLITADTNSDLLLGHLGALHAEIKRIEFYAPIGSKFDHNFRRIDEYMAYLYAAVACIRREETDPDPEDDEEESSHADA